MDKYQSSVNSQELSMKGGEESDVARRRRLSDVHARGRIAALISRVPPQSLGPIRSIIVASLSEKGKRRMKEKRGCVVMVVVMVAICLGLVACASAPMSSAKKADQQDEVRDMAKMTLDQLYAKNPAARGVITSAAGYAVFSDFGFKLLFMGGAKGAGIAVNNATKEETFMKMAEFQPGLGLGANKFRMVFVFENPAAFNSFVTSGWEAGANVMATAKTKTAGGALTGAVSVSEGVYMYQITEAGLIVGVSITGAKYYKDKELN
jgi:lipid-binding SYLF domain-containing protein